MSDTPRVDALAEQIRRERDTPGLDPARRDELAEAVARAIAPTPLYNIDVPDAIAPLIARWLAAERAEAKSVPTAGMLADPSHPMWPVFDRLSRERCAAHQATSPTSQPCAACTSGITVDDLLVTAHAEGAAEALRDAAALHAPKRLGDEFRFKPWCEECSQGFTASGDDPPSERRVYWPCATAKALGLIDPLDPSRAALADPP